MWLCGSERTIGGSVNPHFRISSPMVSVHGLLPTFIKPTSGIWRWIPVHGIQPACFLSALTISSPHTPSIYHFPPFSTPAPYPTHDLQECKLTRPDTHSQEEQGRLNEAFKVVSFFGLKREGGMALKAMHPVHTRSQGDGDGC